MFSDAQEALQLQRRWLKRWEGLQWEAFMRGPNANLSMKKFQNNFFFEKGSFGSHKVTGKLPCWTSVIES